MVTYFAFPVHKSMLCTSLLTFGVSMDLPKTATKSVDTTIKLLNPMLSTEWIVSLGESVFIGNLIISLHPSLGYLFFRLILFFINLSRILIW